MKNLFLIIPLLFIGCAKAADVKWAWDPLIPAPSGVEIRIMDSTDVVIQTQDCGPAPLSECLTPAVTPGNRKGQAFAYQLGVPTAIKQYGLGSNIVSFTVPITPGTIINNHIKIPQ
jgi:hypothetical protein